MLEQQFGLPGIGTGSFGREIALRFRVNQDAWSPFNQIKNYCSTTEKIEKTSSKQ